MNDPLLQLAVVAANTVTLLIGGLVTLFAYRAQRRTGSRSLGLLAVGIGCVTVGTLFAGVLHQSGFAPLLVGVTLHSVSVAVGFVLLGLSLAASDEPPVVDHPSLR